MADGAAVAGFKVTDPINFYDTAADPNPAPGFVTAVNGENDYNVEISLADLTTRTEKHVGAIGPGENVRWIELRDMNAGEL